jgi:preprotein translocase subunit SecE
VLKRIRRYLQESWSELNKVSWPTRTQVRNLTMLVFAISAAIGVYIAVWDFVFTKVLSLLTPSAG